MRSVNLLATVGRDSVVGAEHVDPPEPLEREFEKVSDVRYVTNDDQPGGSGWLCRYSVVRGE